MYYGDFWGPDWQSPSTKFWFLVFYAIVKTAVNGVLIEPMGRGMWQMVVSLV